MHTWCSSLDSSPMEKSTKPTYDDMSFVTRYIVIITSLDILL